MVNKLYYDGCIFSSKRFYDITLVTDISNYTEIDDTTHKIIFHHKKGAKYSSLPSNYVNVLEDKVIVDEHFKLLPVTTIIDYEVIVRFTAPSLCLYTQLISHKIPEYKYEEYDNGCCIIISDEYKNMQELVKYINANSTMVYLTGLSDFYNILGLDLKYGGTINPTDTSVYDAQKHVFLNESNVVSSYIKYVKDNFKEITITNISSEVDYDDKTTELLTYRTSSILPRSNIYTSNIVMTSPYGKLITSEIQVSWVYSTSDIVTFLERRNSYMFHSFVNKISVFPVIMYDDKDNIVDKFTFAVHTDKGNLDPDVSKNQTDNRRSKYTFTFIAQIHCYLLEEFKEQSIKTIENVIANIYVKNGG